MTESTPRQPARTEPTPDGDADVVERASEQSFPASDAPGWAIGRDHEPAPVVPAMLGAKAASDRHRDDSAPPGHGAICGNPMGGVRDHRRSRR